MSSSQTDQSLDHIAEASGASDFSTPLDNTSYISFDYLIKLISCQVIEIFVDQRCPYASSERERLISFFAKPNSLDLLWAPAVGACFQAVQKDGASNSNGALLDLLLHACSWGLKGSWQVEIDQPRLVTYKQKIFRAEGKVSIENDGKNGVLVRLGNRILSVENEPEQRDFPYYAALPLIQHGKHTVTVITNQHRPKWFTLDVSLEEAPLKEFSVLLFEALELLATRSPAYYQWTMRVLRYVGLIAPPQHQRLYSASVQWLWATIGVSPSTNPLHIGEMIVHECAHLYFEVLSRLNEPTMDQSLHYSPLKQTLRPLERLMLGYHAFGNVYLYYQDCSRDPALAAECRHEMDIVAADLRLLASSVEKPELWTNVGAALLQPLMQRLQGL